MTKTYDINIWDRLSYETSGKETGGWMMNFYQYPQIGAHYGSGKMIEELDLVLTADEVKRLTLGWGKDLGGDYTEDEDFWIDTESFLHEYTDIPDRVREHINSLPEYEQIVEPFESSVKWAG
jgi:hypothetical protein